MFCTAIAAWLANAPPSDSSSGPYGRTVSWYRARTPTGVSRNMSGNVAIVRYPIVLAQPCFARGSLEASRITIGSLWRIVRLPSPCAARMPAATART